MNHNPLMKLVLRLSVVCACAFLGVFTEKCHRRVCNLYLDNGYRHMFRPRDIVNPMYCTHAVLYRVHVTDRQDIFLPGTNLQEEFRQIEALKKGNPKLITIFAVQNDAEYALRYRTFKEFLQMYMVDSSRQKFIGNIISFVRSKSIDGIKIDVQTGDGGSKEKFTALIKELKAAIMAESVKTKKEPLLLTVGIPSDKTFLDKYYDVATISNYVDMVDLATNSFQALGKCVKNPQHHSPLYSQDPSSTRTIDFMSRYVVEQGISKDKINVGLSVSSMSYYGIYECGYFINHWYTTYDIVCSQLVKDLYQAKYVKLDTEVGRVATHDNNAQKIFYDDPDTIKIKVKYIKEKGFSGVFLSYARHDDYINSCKHGVYPILKTVFDECR